MDRMLIALKDVVGLDDSTPDPMVALLLEFDSDRYRLLSKGRKMARFMKEMEDQVDRVVMYSDEFLGDAYLVTNPILRDDIEGAESCLLTFEEGEWEDFGEGHDTVRLLLRGVPVEAHCSSSDVTFVVAHSALFGRTREVWEDNL